MKIDRAREIVDGFDGRRVLVVGDVMLDEYIFGRVSRISPEAPVPVIDADHHTFVPGGAANVVNNLCALDAKTSIAGVVGEDGAARTLAEKLTDEGADTAGLTATASRPTTLKTRLIAHSQQGSQQIARIDHERRDPIDTPVIAKLSDFLTAAIPHCDAVLLSDYQKGLLGREFVGTVVETARAAGKIVTGNIKPRGIGPHCRFSMITLNVFEASEASGMMLGEGGDGADGTLREAGRILLQKTRADTILITRGAHGLSLFSSDGETFSLPAHPVEVFDGTGAGDTVISTLTLALAAGATPAEAVTLANYAAAAVVKKIGVATVSRAELLHMMSEDV